jgi:hypothetical protein
VARWRAEHGPRQANFGVKNGLKIGMNIGLKNGLDFGLRF